jgi:hypothetical protein
MKDSSLLEVRVCFSSNYCMIIIFSCKSRDTKKITLPDEPPTDTSFNFCHSGKRLAAKPAGATNVKSEE